MIFKTVLVSLCISATAFADGLAPPKLVPPAEKPETYGDAQDFPFVTPLAGAKLVGTSHDATPIDVTGPDDKEPQLVGSGTVNKQYQGPDGIVDDDFKEAWEKAFRGAGWTLKPVSSGGVMAHWSKGGRELWVRVWTEGGNTWNVTLADLSSGLAAALKKNCKVALYGLNFDFNKATLRADSEPVLKQVLAILKQDPASKFSLGGHTDNVGDHGYNQKLSAQRAEAVKGWLVAHGAAVAQLSTQGFGDTAPVVPNDSDVNRAKNRRVELSRSGCKE